MSAAAVLDRDSHEQTQFDPRGEMNMRLPALLSVVIVVPFVASLSSATAADLPSWPPGTCVYRDLHYTNGTVICVAPHFGQMCKDGVWTPPTNEAPLQEPPRQEAPLQVVCATAQIPTNPAPPTPIPPSVACTYHGVQYSDGSQICIAPGVAQKCAKNSDGKDGSWNVESASACDKAQIPNPGAAPPPPPSAK